MESSWCTQIWTDEPIGIEVLGKTWNTFFQFTSNKFADTKQGLEIYLETFERYLFISREFKGKPALLFMQNYQPNLTSQWNSHLMLQRRKENETLLLHIGVKESVSHIWVEAHLILNDTYTCRSLAYVSLQTKCSPVSEYGPKLPGRFEVSTSSTHASEQGVAFKLDHFGIWVEGCYNSNTPLRQNICLRSSESTSSLSTNPSRILLLFSN